MKYIAGNIQTTGLIHILRVRPLQFNNYLIVYLIRTEQKTLGNRAFRDIVFVVLSDSFTFGGHVQ